MRFLIALFIWRGQRSCKVLLLQWRFAKLANKRRSVVRTRKVVFYLWISSSTKGSRICSYGGCSLSKYKSTNASSS